MEHIQIEQIQSPELRTAISGVSAWYDPTDENKLRLLDVVIGELEIIALEM